MELLVFVEVLALVGASALCSGLNIGIVSVDLGELQRKAVLGNVAARRVLPYRKNLHLTLAAILLSNVAAISGTSLVLNNRYNGFVAEIAATLLIVVGLRRKYAPIRYFAMTVFVITIAKVFAIDLAELDRLYRVLSVLGLGVTLLMTSYLYQKLNAETKGA